MSIETTTKVVDGITEKIEKVQTRQDNMNGEILGKVKNVVAEKLNVGEDQVTTEAKFVEDLGADSLDQVELIMALEDDFDLKIPEEEAEKLVTVGSAVSN